MIHLSDYFQFINESKDNVYSDLSNIIINKFNNNNNNSFIVNEYSKILGKRKFKIKDLKVNFELIKTSDNYCNGVCDITNSLIENEYLKNASLSFYIGYKELNADFITYINSVIIHEVMHLYQSYNLKINNKFKPESWVIGSLIPTFRDFFKTSYSKNILHLIYLSLSHEIYSQLQQYYFYNKDDISYDKIDDIISELRNFKIKILNEYEKAEIMNMKKFIVKGLKNNNNKKYKKDVNKSIWNEQDINLFLVKLKEYFDNKATLINDKIKKINKELSIEDRINDSLNEWISLPSNFENMEIDHYSVVDRIIGDI